jgi:hypothetical protein
MMMPLIRVPAVVALAVCFGAASPAGAQWRRIDSPNFVVIGETGASDLRNIALKFEAFRETLSRVLTERAVATAVPTIVIVFRHDRAFRPFMPKVEGNTVEAGGLFVGGPDVNYIAIVGDGEPWRLPVVFHEYAHLIVSNVGRHVPVWLNEGLAEYYSTFELIRDGREALLGIVEPGRLALLHRAPLLPLETLLTVDHDSPLYNESNRRSTFYAQSWALTHLILHDKPDRMPQLLAYLENLSSGMPPKQAWDRAFASEDIGRLLDGYIRRRALMGSRHLFDDKLATFDASATSLPLAEAEAFLAEFLIQQGRTDEASDRLRAASKTDPGNARLALAAASLDIARRDHAGGAARLRALGAPTDWVTAYLAGIAVADLARLETDRPAPEWLDAARRHFSTARAARSEFPNALARLAELDLQSRAGPSAGARAAIERARTQTPGRYDYDLIYAQILAWQSDFAGARTVLGRLTSNQYPANVRDYARAVMARIVDLETSLLKPSGGLRAVAPSSPPAGAVSLNLPTPAARRPAFRDVQPGEQRTEGVLAGIVCPAGSPIFELTTPAGLMTFTARQLADVDLISYRVDVTGTTDCGPFKEPMAVYLTWRPGPDGLGTRIAVAIEFLPKQP